MPGLNQRVYAFKAHVIIILKVPKGKRDSLIADVSEIVGLTPYLDRKPANLSSGQRQRVALARAIVLLGFMIPQQVTFVPVYLIFSKAKMLQSYWPQILPFIANAFGIFLLRQYFLQIPEEIIEAARMDNASEPKIIFSIMIPMAKTALLTIGLLSFISLWNSYFWPLIMTTKNTYRPLAVGVAMLKNVDSAIPWHMLMAGNLFLTCPILIAYAFANKQIRKAFVYSGIK